MDEGPLRMGRVVGREPWAGLSKTKEATYPGLGFGGEGGGGGVVR